MPRRIRMTFDDLLNMHENFLNEKEAIEDTLNEIHNGRLENHLMAMHENLTLAIDDIEKAIDKIKMSREKSAKDEIKEFTDKVCSMFGKPIEEWEKEGLIYHGPEEHL